MHYGSLAEQVVSSRAKINENQKAGIAVCRALICNFFLSANIGPRSGPGTGKKASYGSGKQTLRLKSNGTAAIEEVDNVRTQAEENINKLLETFMGINDSELGRPGIHLVLTDF